MSLNSLDSLLKKLRLSGVEQTVEERLKQAQENQFSHREFLQILLEDEQQYREAKALSKRLSDAKFEEEKTIEGLDCKLYTPKIQKIIRDLACGHYLGTHEHVIVMGPTGTGKTHLAQGLGHHACRQGKKVLFIRANSFFKQLCAARADNTWDKAFKKFLQPDVLILDDFGLKPLTLMQSEDIYELIAERHLKSSFIITSNRSVEGWVELFPDPVMANAALDRLAHQAHHLILVGESYRKRAKPETIVN